MARTRTTSISETVSFLKDLIRQNEGTSTELRLRFMLSLRQNPGQTIGHAAAIIGISQATAERWWREYRTNGLTSLLHKPASQKNSSSRIPDHVIEEIRLLRDRGALQHIADIIAWLRDHHNLQFSRSGIRHVIKTCLAETVTHTPVEQDQNAQGTALFGTRALAFLNAIPFDSSTVDWIGRLSNTLQTLFRDIDRVSISVNVACDLLDPDAYHPNLIINHHSIGDSEVLSTDAIASADLPSQMLLKDFKQQRMPLGQYQSPHCYDLYLNTSAYVGSILLWRDRTSRPVSSSTLSLMSSLLPFLTVILANHIALRQLARPAHQIYQVGLDMMVKEAKLTVQERRVAALQLLGHTNKETAAVLSVSLGTVKKHVASIYRKTMTNSSSELFARYFSPHNIRDQHS